MTTKISTDNIQASTLTLLSGSGTGVTAYATIAELPLAGNDPGSMAFVEQNNRLYIWTGVGWFNIALINTNPTISQGPDPSYVFATDGAPIVITLVAEDPEGIPITWSSQVTSGTLGNTAVISQNNNVFTITPSTDSADAATFSVTFVASDGVNIATAVSSFTLRFTAADAYYNQSILLTTTSENNANNNTFVDSSSNNFAITRAGNTTQGTFGPYSPAGWSGYFDGNNDYLTTPSSTEFTLGTGNFTMECWFNLTNTKSTSTQLFDLRTAEPSVAPLLYINGSVAGAPLQMEYYVNGAVRIATTVAPNTNMWYHVAVVKNNGITKLYIDGTQIGSSYTDNNDYIGTIATVGGRFAAVSGDFRSWNGYISNVRIVKGTAVYTANFTPPVEPVTAIAGTSLLTLQDNRFIDRSTNNLTITKFGDTRITPFSPFLPTVPYSPSVHGGSAYFDGAGDELTIANNAAFNLGTGDFTAECWFNISADSTANADGNRSGFLFGPGQLVNAAAWMLELSGNSTTTGVALAFQSRNSSGTPTILSYSFTFAKNTWYHAAASKVGNTLALFVNGQKVAENTNWTVLTDSGGSLFRIGRRAISANYEHYFNGYISNIRVIKGIGLYTANFTPPTQPLTAIANTSLLLNSTNAGIFDETGKVVLVTVGDARTSTAVVKYGDTSMFFDGTGDRLNIPAGPNVDLGTGDFTFEAWSYLTVAGDAYRSIFTLIYPTSKIVALRYGNGGFGQKLQVGVQSDTLSTTWSTSLTQTASLNQWIHLAFTRSSGVCRLFVNGQLQNINSGANPSTYPVTSFNDTTNITGSSSLLIGSDNYTGYLSDVRITRGYARYTTNFTPPTQKLGYTNPE